jgi:hypothetical protein
MKVDTPLLVERRDRIARYLLANGKQRGLTLAAELSIPESVVSGLLKHWSDVVPPMSRWWHFCDTWQPGDQVVEAIDD